MKNVLLASIAAVALTTTSAFANDIVNSRDDFLAFTKLVVAMATRQGVQPQKTCDSDGCETSYVTKIADDLVRVDTETYTGKPEVVVFCKGKATDGPYRFCNDSNGRIYREKLIDGEFRLETVQRLNWPLPAGLY